MNLFELRNDKSREVLEQLGKAIENAMEAVGMEAEGDVKEITPVDTGNLRNSITHQYSKVELAEYIGTDVEYAPYVEFGTSRMKEAHPFLKPTIAENMDKYKEIITEELTKGMEK